MFCFTKLLMGFDLTQGHKIVTHFFGWVHYVQNLLQPKDINMKLTTLQKQALALTDLIAVKNKQYLDLNNQITDLQGDFPTHLQVIDGGIEASLVKLLDEILGEELASYFIYECQNTKDGGCITNNGKEYKIRTIKDLEDYLSSII